MTATAEVITPTGSSGSAHNPVANLRPWVKGQSGNPSGTRSMKVIAGLLAKAGPRAMERLVELIESDDERIALLAAKEVLDRAYGKPKPIEDESTEKGKSVTINILRYGDAANETKSGGASATAVQIRSFEREALLDCGAAEGDGR